jgi:alpha-mannosidase
VSDGEVGLLLTNQGLPEIEVLRTEAGSEMALTLLRCVGWLSRADLSVRKGHAGPGLPTPEAQCHGTYTFHYALVPHQGGWQQAFTQAHAFNGPFRAVPTPAHEGMMPSCASYVHASPETMVISAMKDAEDGDGLIVRLWNADDEDREAEIRLFRQPSRVTLCNLAERNLEELSVDEEGIVCTPVRGREILTLRVEF